VTGVVQPAAGDHVEPLVGDPNDREGTVAVVVADTDLRLGVVRLEDPEALPLVLLPTKPVDWPSMLAGQTPP
jgi:hypothetical protein